MPMNKVSGVTILYPEFFYGLKSYALLFDKFYVYGLSVIDYLDVKESSKAEKEFLESLRADVEFLKEEGVLVEVPLDAWKEVDKEAHASEDYKKLIKTFDNATVNDQNLAWDHDYFTRLASAKMAAKGVEAVPICEVDFPTELFGPKSQPKEADMWNTLRIGLNALPAPDDSCSWERILDFREEMSDELWDFRRFLRDLSAKKQTESEIRDDIEWTLNKYRKAMRRHQLESRLVAVGTFVVTSLAIMESLHGIPWSAIAGGALVVIMKRVELLRDEMNAPGKDCAYILEAQQQFRTQSQTAMLPIPRPALSWPL